MTALAQLQPAPRQARCIDCRRARDPEGGLRCPSCATRTLLGRGLDAAIPRTTDWCSQCERRVTREEASRCASRWCSVKGSA